MAQPGDILSFAEMCMLEGKMLQQGMHFRSGSDRHSVILMSRQHGAKYADGIAEDGKTIHYIGHDAVGDRAKTLDQPLDRISGTLTENGKFFKAVEEARQGYAAEPVRVYEKLKQGIWVYNGLFSLVDAAMSALERRKVCVFTLSLVGSGEPASDSGSLPTEAYGRLIPTDVKLLVWQRDRGRCIACGSTEDLHFDHIIPYSLGGSSLDVRNIQILCRTCNLKKSDSIQ